jgi:hypothetical protein
MHVVVKEMDKVMILCFLYISYFDNGYLQTDSKEATPTQDSDSQNSFSELKCQPPIAMKSPINPSYQFSYFVLSRSSSE